MLPRFTKDREHARRPINARAETVATSGMFRSAFAGRRCLVPAMAFYEWQAVPGDLRQPFAITRADGHPIAFAGSGHADHPRAYGLAGVLGEVEGDPAALLHPPAEGVLRIWPVSRKVNSPRNNGAELLDPLGGVAPAKAAAS